MVANLRKTDWVETPEITATEVNQKSQPQYKVVWDFIFQRWLPCNPKTWKEVVSPVVPLRLLVFTSTPMHILSE